MLRGSCLLCLIVLFLTSNALAQDSVFQQTIELPDKYLNSVNKKINGLDGQLTTQTEKYLHSLSKQEENIRKKLAKLDSSKAAELFGDSKKVYDVLLKKITSANGKVDNAMSGQYIPYLDSLQGSLRFLKDAKNVISKSKDIQQKLGNSLAQVKQLETKLQEAGQVNQYLQERQEQLKGLLNNYSNLPKDISKYFGKYEQQIYYYGRHLTEYKEMLNDPDKLVRKVLSTLTTIPAFQKFMGKYSMLAGVFSPLPEPGAAAMVNPALQTRSQVMALVQQRVAAGGPDARQMISQQLQQAQGELAKLKDKFSELGVSPGGDMNMPEFKPNRQKTKSFLKRLEFGSNFQAQKANSYFPVTTDFAGTVGYKINDKSVAGIGLSGRVGWGQGWKHIKVTGQGVGMRLFVDWKVKGNFWLTAGAEMNYNKSVESLEVFKNYSTWSKSALAGVSRKYKIGKKLKGNMQVLYDFLHQYQTPPTPAFVWRVGYNF